MSVAYTNSLLFIYASTHCRVLKASCLIYSRGGSDGSASGSTPARQKGLRGCLTIQAWVVGVETAYGRASDCTSDTSDKSHAALCAIGPQKVKRERPELRPFSHWRFLNRTPLLSETSHPVQCRCSFGPEKLNIKHSAGVCIGQGAYRPPRAGPRFSGDWRVGPSSNKSGCSAGPPRG